MSSNLMFICTEDSIVAPFVYDKIVERYDWEVYKVKDLSSGMKYWNKAANSNRAVLLSSYPLEDQEDLAVIDMFVEDMNKSEVQTYYAPRPNHFVEVDAPALMGATRPYKFNILQKLFVSYFQPGLKALAKKLTALFPYSSRRKIIQYLKGVQQSLMGIKHEEQGVQDVIGAKPSIKLPVFLNNCPGSWKPWKVSSNVLNRDIVERVGRFFPYPGHLHVILLNKCNLKCVMCPYHSPKYKEAHTSGYFDSYKSMSKATFEKIATYAGQRGISLQFGQIEEVLMHKDAIEFIALAKKKGVPHVHLTTNGVLLTREKADELAESGIDSVMFSIDASTPETYKEIRGHDLVELEKRAQYFISLAKEKCIKTVASFILQPMATKERDAFINKWKGFGIDTLTFYVLTDHDPKTGDFIREGQNIYDHGGRYACASPWMQAVVFPKGEISLCCKTMTDVGWRGVVDMGNVNDDNLDDIWKGERYATVRKELLQNNFQDYDVCKKCDIWSAHTSLVEHGDGWVRTFNETMETYEFLEDAA